MLDNAVGKGQGRDRAISPIRADNNLLRLMPKGISGPENVVVVGDDGGVPRTGKQPKYRYMAQGTWSGAISVACGTQQSGSDVTVVLVAGTSSFFDTSVEASLEYISQYYCVKLLPTADYLYTSTGPRATTGR